MDAKPNLSRMPDYQHFNDIKDMEEMEELPKETWEDKFREAMEYFQRAGVMPEVSKDEDNGGDDNDNGEEGVEEEKYTERYLKRMKSWVADINIDNLPKVTRKNMENYAKGFGDKFTSELMEATGDLRESV